ncbi:hypothetical protein [Halomonas sp. SL1]|uniref:hypothetical protein n=1 Tax=Halomonas sp. SL1 TaxID=2137478 RepID=UPI0015EB78AD|nr:hypothetical protein [Halomonas sp. SL1]
MMTLSTPLRNARLQAVADAIDAAREPGTLTLYTGPRPGNGAAITIEVALVTIPCPRPFAASIENGVLTGVAFPEVMATAGGDAVWGRYRDGDGGFVADADVGELDAQGNPTSDINLPSRLIYAGMLVRITALTLVE